MLKDYHSLYQTTSLGNVIIKAQTKLDTRLIKACLDANEEKAKYLMTERWADFNCCVDVVLNDFKGDRTWYDMTPFLAACWARCSPLSSLLLVKGVNVNHASKGSTSPVGDSVNPGWTALHISARWNDIEMYKFLKSRGASVTDDDDGMSPLLVGALYNAEQLVRHLMQESTDYSRETKINAMELLATHHCNKLNHLETVRELWEEAMTERKREPVIWKEETDAFGNITEADSHRELADLFKANSWKDIRIQGMMVKERVCGKTSSYVTAELLVLAADFSKEEKLEDAYQSWFRALTNLPGRFTVGKLMAYSNLFKCLQCNWRKAPAEIHAMNVDHVMLGLELAFADFQLEIFSQPDNNEEIFRCHKDLQRQIWRLLSFVEENIDRANDLESLFRLVRCVRSKRNQTLLHIACGPEMNCDTDARLMSVVRLLLAAKCDKYASDDDGRTPLQLAQIYRCPLIINILETYSFN